MFDLEKALKNDGKCLVKRSGETFEGEIVCTTMAESSLVVVCPTQDSIYRFYADGSDYASATYIAAVCLENVPDTYDVWVCVVESATGDKWANAYTTLQNAVDCVATARGAGDKVFGPVLTEVKESGPSVLDDGIPF